MQKITRRFFCAGAASATMMPVAAEAQYDAGNARRIANEIIAVSQRQIASATPENPFFIMLGEDHLNREQVLASQFVTRDVNRLCIQQGKRMLFGHEIAYDAVEQEIKKALRGRVPAQWQNQHDPHGLNSLAIMSTYMPRSQSRYSFLNLSSFLIENRIPNRFLDAGRNGDYVDLSDPVIARAASRFAGQTIHVRTPNGIALRNISLANRGLAAAKSIGASVVVLPVGLKHLFENGDLGRVSEYGVQTILKNLGAHTLTVPLQTNMSAQAVNALPQRAGIFIPAGVSQVIPAQNDQQEIQYLNNACRASGQSDCFYLQNGEPYKQRADAFFGDMARLVGALVPRFR